MVELDEEDLTDARLLQHVLGTHFGVATAMEASELLLVPPTARHMVREAADLLIQKSVMHGWPRHAAIQYMVRMYEADTSGNKIRRIMQLIKENP